ncbi:Pol protein [Phytophthora palmivora]|uniref:Pol protein n=1 Tax=Phytophthora palmivora TaxID=4796 RepID=A0A2P4YQZ8_9STRA|nr:Pol protein [Phytophthora palmivora]
MEDALERFTKQCPMRLGSEILKNSKDPVYPLVNGFSDVVSKHLPSQLPPDQGVRHEICSAPCQRLYNFGTYYPLKRQLFHYASFAIVVDVLDEGLVRYSVAGGVDHTTVTQVW